MTRPTVPAKHRVEALIWILVGIAFLAGFVGGTLRKERVVTHTRVTHPSVSQQLGKPDQTVAGAQINQALSGLSCDVYQSKAVIYCHR